MRDIMLKITGRLVDDQGEADQIEFVTEGKLYEKGDSFYLIYEESEFSGMPGCKTSLKISENSLRMNRLGEVHTALEFEKGKRYNGIYDTPYGPVEMEVLTDRFEKNINSEGLGELDVDYTISLKGFVEARNKLSIEIRG